MVRYHNATGPRSSQVLEDANGHRQPSSCSSRRPVPARSRYAANAAAAHEHARDANHDAQ